ncbi:MAG TPA: TonB-dependent receptor [Thermoanaerobaculia bacterium]|jgi:outer membrane receptor protein involved in Fe transport
MKSRGRVVSAIALAGALVLLAAPLAAQRVTGQINGTVRDDEGGVLPGVTVSLTGETVAGAQTAITLADGFYRFLGLAPGFYDLKFELEGFAPLTRTGVRVSLGASTVEDVSLKVGELSEAITVTAEAPVVDTESNEVGANYGRDWVANAPVQRLSFNDLVAAAPGSLRGGDTSRRTMVYGSSYDENSFQLDGADVNDNFFNEQLAQPNIDAIEEIEILSLGAPAEYGNLTGAVYNIVTRQGTNQFRGDVSFYTQLDGLTDSNTDETDNEGFPFERDEYTDYSAQVGGPISRDKVWFFASFQHQEDSFLAVGANPSVGPLATSSAEYDRYFGKLNVQINQSHRLQVTYHQDESLEAVGIGVDVAPTTAFAREGKTPTPGLGYTGIVSPKTFVEARFTGFYGDVFLGPADPAQPRDLARFIDLDTGFISGGHYYWYDLQPERSTLNVKVSHLAEDFLKGDHDFRFGVQYNESEAGGVYGYNDLILTYQYGGAQYGYGYTRVPFSYSGNTEAIGLFVDDTWHVSDRLTLNLGVRYDSNDAFSREQQELDENLRPTGVVFPRADFYTWEYVSPRLGFNYKLTADGRTVLKGHFGRYQRAIATGEFANVIGPSIKPIFAGPFDPATNTFLDLFQITDNSNLSVDPGYDSPRTDQFILSLEREVGHNLGGYLNLVHKRGRDFAAWRDVGGIYEEVVWIDGDYDLDGVVDGDDPFATGDPITLFRLLNSPSDRAFQITNRDEMDIDIYAASLGVIKPMSNRWSLNASLTYLRSEGRTPDSGGGSNVQQRGGLQFRQFGRNPNDFVNTGGRLRGDVPWQFKTQLVYQLPKGFLAAVNLSVYSGANRVRIVRPPREVTNLSTTILAQERGSFGRLPSAALVDLRLEKEFTLAGDVRLGIIADVFNVLNDDSYLGVRSSISTASVFDLPAGFVLPRRVQLGAKLRF